MIEIKLEEIVYREDLYPRFEPNAKTIEQYSETIEQLPPIIINQNNILVDGYHRLKAHEKAKVKTIKAEILNLETDDDVYWESIKRNSTHGLQLNSEEKQDIANRYIEIKSVEELARFLSVSVPTINNWTKAARDAIEKRNKRLTIELWWACHSENEIAEKIGKTHQTIHNWISGGLANFAKISDFGRFPHEWREKELKLYNIWNFAKNTNYIKHPGNVPQGIVENLLYYYTEPFDIVYDPFAGGGITIDACKKWKRRFYVSDIAPTTMREHEIRQYDITNGVPFDVLKKLSKGEKGIKLIFLDPPYWTQKAGEYTEQLTDLSKVSLVDYYGYMQAIFDQSAKALCDGGIIAVIVGPTQKDMKIYDHAFNFYEFLNESFAFENRIILPYSTQQAKPADVEMAKEKRMMLKLYRDMLIFRKA